MTGLSLGVAASTSRGGGLESDVSALVRSAKVGAKADVGVSVRNIRTGQVVVDINGSTPLIPASNQKVLSTGAALLALGPDHVFETRLDWDGQRLVVRGCGDPNFGDPELLARVPVRRPDGSSGAGLAPEQFVDLWARQVAAKGITRVPELVVDDSVFAREGPHPSWPADQLDEDYCALPSGLNFHANTLLFRPVLRSESIVVETVPPSPWVMVENQASTKRGKKDKHAPWLRRTSAAADSTFLLKGNVRDPNGGTIDICLREPALYYGQLLESRLEAVGVRVDSVRLIGPADADANAGSLAAAAPPVRTSIVDAVRRANTDSSNLHAESLLKVTAQRASGMPATWASSCDVLARTLSSVLGAESTGFVVADGCGLARSNRVTPNGMTAWLAHLDRQPSISAAMRESMAIAGKTGTVKSRMRDLSAAGKVVACKTGYIHGVCALSGYVEGPDGTPYSFSIIGNDLTAGGAVGAMKSLQDAIVTRIARGERAGRS